MVGYWELLGGFNLNLTAIQKWENDLLSRLGIIPASPELLRQYGSKDKWGLWALWYGASRRERKKNHNVFFLPVALWGLSPPPQQHRQADHFFRLATDWVLLRHLAISREEKNCHSWTNCCTMVESTPESLRDFRWYARETLQGPGQCNCKATSNTILIDSSLCSSGEFVCGILQGSLKNCWNPHAPWFLPAVKTPETPWLQRTREVHDIYRKKNGTFPDYLCVFQKYPQILRFVSPFSLQL